jgi:hypothetical protein
LDGFVHPAANEPFRRNQQPRADLTPPSLKPKLGRRKPCAANHRFEERPGLWPQALDGVLVQRLLASGTIQQGSRWFPKLAGVAIALFGIYFITHTFIDNRA